MNLLDFAVLALTLFLAARGYFRGFFREFFGLLAWLAGGIAGYVFAPELAPLIARPYRLPIALAQVAVFGAIFLGVYIACRLTGWVLAQLARALFLSPLDRVAGLVFGAAKGVVIAALFCMMVTSRRGLPDLAERVNESPMLSTLVAEGWDLFALAQVNADVHGSWQHPYSKMEIEAREALSHFLTPKPSSTPAAPSSERRATPGEASR